MVEGYKRGIWFIGKESPSLLCRQPPLGKRAIMPNLSRHKADSSFQKEPWLYGRALHAHKYYGKIRKNKMGEILWNWLSAFL